MKLFKIQYLFLLVSCFIMFSCSNNDDIEEQSVPEYMIVKDSIGETGYDYTIINPSDDYVNFVKVKGDGYVEEMDILYNNYVSKTIVQFYDNGLVKSIGTDEFILVFSNYLNNKVDVAVVTDGESKILYGLEMDVDWDKYIQNVSRTVDSQNDKAEKIKELLNYFGELLETHRQLIAEGIEGKVNKLDILFYLGGIFFDSAEYIFVNDEQLKHTISVVEFSTALAAGALKWTGPWGVFFTLLLNYDDYRDWVADEVYNFMMLVDKLTPKVEEGTGALLRIAINSSEETLPAEHNEGKVTFTLNTNVTYTQMGADVKEWGVALFKGNELIGKYPVANISEKTQFIDFSFDIAKKQFNLDYDDYIATPKDEWYLKAYEINNQNPDVPIFGRNKMVLDLLYNQKPSITMYDLKVGETVSINEGYWTKLTYYTYKWVLTGSLFMNDSYLYYAGNWVNTGKGDSITLWDGKYQSNENTRVLYAPTTQDMYIYFVSTVNGKLIKSLNHLYFYVNQDIINISLVEGEAESRTRSFNDNGVMGEGIIRFSPIRIVNE